jgi:hypothetical protein
MKLGFRLKPLAIDGAGFRKPDDIALRYSFAGGLVSSMDGFR